jgi:hypothetical protein
MGEMIGRLQGSAPDLGEDMALDAREGPMVETELNKGLTTTIRPESKTRVKAMTKTMINPTKRKSNLL